MGKMPLYTMLQKARSAGGWTMVAQQLVSTLLQAQTSLRSALARCRSW